MAWLENVIQRRYSKDEKDWIKLMGIDTIEAKRSDQLTKRKCVDDSKQLKKLKIKVEPKWYQELSDRQIKGLDLLYDAVRNDYDLRESHRVFFVLKNIGLHPVPSHSLIRRSLILSQGHELAFLWFLTDIWYLTFHNYHRNSGTFYLRLERPH